MSPEDIFRFRLKIIQPDGSFREILFRSLVGLRQWIENARETGELKEEEKIRAYDKWGEL